jgi:hypothetical protein
MNLIRYMKIVATSSNMGTNTVVLKLWLAAVLASTCSGTAPTLGTGELGSELTLSEALGKELGAKDIGNGSLGDTLGTILADGTTLTPESQLGDGKLVVGQERNSGDENFSQSLDTSTTKPSESKTYLADRIPLLKAP